MLLKSLAFEWRYYLRQPSIYVTSLVFFLLPFLATTSENVQIGGGGNVLYNGSFSVTQTMLILGLFGLFLLVNFVAGTATRNHTSNMGELIYTRPIKPFAYQFGRFLGAYAISMLVFTAVPLGIILGSVMPWVDPERIGPTDLSFYTTTYFYFIAPSLFALGMIIYTVSLRIRSMMGAYLVALGMFIAYVVGGTLASEPEYRSISALLDPFGLRTFSEISRYWTIFDKNSAVIAFEGVLVYNRLIWLSIGGAIMLLFGQLGKFNWQQSTKKAKPSKAERTEPPRSTNIKIKAQTGSQWQNFVTRLGFEMRQVLFSPALLVLLIFTLFNLSSIYFSPIGGMYGTPDWPLTKNMIDAISGNFSLMLIIVITYYSGEIIWRERGAGMGDIIDSTPAFNLVFWTSKLLAMWAVIASLFVVGMLFTLFFQLVKGYTHFELSLYLFDLFYINLIPWGLLSVLAFFIQVLSPNKFIGMLIFVAYFIASLSFSELGIEHNMWSFAQTPRVLYSDLNGYGWFLEGFNWYILYWSAASLVLSTIGYALWQRGPSVALRDRIRLISYQLGTKGKGVLAASLVLFLATGGYIHYNTKVLNTFVGSEALLDLRADYEKEYVAHEDDNIPVIQKVNAKVDIFPYQRRIEASADIVVTNKGSSPIERFLVNIPQHTSSWELEVEGAQITQQNPRLNTAWMTLDSPIQPGEQRNGVMTVVRAHQGFKDRNHDLVLAENGTFIDSGTLFPSFGFNTQYLIQDRHERRKRDLPERARDHKLEDESRYTESFFGKATDFIEFETTVSTAGDQIAIAPGYLQKQWQENGRNVFHYKMDAPIVNFYSFLSARHEVIKEEYKGVNIEIYYHPTHHWNTDIMIQGVKDSLDYFTEHFGPYQHRQMRIIEFPGYRSFAQSFANTVPYSENIGFTANLSDPEDIDYVYYVTAHEVAHQWWGHQVGSANVQGSAIISESLSQYSAIMVLMQRYGEDKIRKFLKYELDSYLRGRGSERIEEMPFMRSENQSYIHYRKGSVVMTSLWDRLGEKHVNHALRTLVERFKFSSNPFATTLDLKAALKADASADEQAFIDSLFNEITLYDLKTTQAEITETEGGGYTVTMTVQGKRFIADGQGMETEQPLDEWVDIALFDGDPEEVASGTEVVYKQKHKLESGDNTIVIHVDKRPTHAGVDPFVKMIDRDTGDNVIRL